MGILGQIAITVLKEDRIMQKNVYSKLENNTILLSDVIGHSQATEGRDHLHWNKESFMGCLGIKT